MRVERGNKATPNIQSIIDSAKKSLDMLSPTGNGMLHAFESFKLRDGIPSGKRLRFIINAPPSKRWEFTNIDPGDFFGSHGWFLRYIQRSCLDGFLILDDRRVVLAKIDERDSKYIINYSVINDSAVDPIKKHFERLWQGHESLDLVYEDLIDSSFPRTETRIVTVSNEQWNGILASLTRNPRNMYSLHPRKFEELVAELLLRNGMTIELTPPTKDGGRDILAFSNTDAGQHLYYVECKRYSSENPVGVSLVRALYGTVEADKATGGLLVTTSYFTKGAMEFRDSVRHRLALKDYDRLVEWLRKSTR